MAEAAVESPSRFYCHHCSVEILPKLPEYVCPRCEEGFIEEMSVTDNTLSEERQDPSHQLAELWGRTFLDSIRRQTEDHDEDVFSNSRPPPQVSFHQVFPRPRMAFHRTAARGTDRHPAIDGILHQILGGLLGGQAVLAGGVPFGVIHGNPGDYAWGSGGLDAIITQLLNQLEGVGPPPASTEKIAAIPTVSITQDLVDKTVQCSVCMEDFTLEEEARKLPCNHYYHSACITRWLEMHGTCPVCRKTLDGEDTSDKDYLPPQPVSASNQLDSSQSGSSSASPDNGSQNQMDTQPN
ncbi:E3 ubiquitin-protein ligase RNF115 [Lingula anatina]|uniref:RING-type E3 ubiquitin transferase n=1 Tax=Lingula anatina TaxID=7574 RepID=A0A1S3K762_LINAN|nr:E3 ubiquitin-protein ligase RNF115 [Lingula anatina]|eukprot:XP_013418096.1 E3 ubiquitin-protein ligase RNF115 [Lingula anatina]